MRLYSLSSGTSTLQPRQ